MTDTKPIRVLVWRAVDGAVTRKREYQQLPAAVAFAIEASAVAGVRNTDLTIDGQIVSTFARGKYRKVRVTAANRNTKTVERQLAFFDEHRELLTTAAASSTHDDNTDNGEDDMTAKNSAKKNSTKTTAKKTAAKTTTKKATDMGKEVPVTKAGKKTSTRAPKVKITSRMTWDILLGMTDAQLMTVDMKHFPKTAPVDFAPTGDVFAMTYVKFLTGGRRKAPSTNHFAGRVADIAELNSRKSWVRDCIAKGKIVKSPFPPVLSRKAKTDLAADTKPKTAAKKTAAAKPKSAAKKKTTAKKTTAKKPAAKKATAAKSAAPKAAAAKRSTRGRSVKVVVKPVAKRSTKKKGN